jgi:predicted  nucleic acid-binding Zn-ribbon protein
VARPSTEKAVPLVRESTLGIEKVRSENEELRATVDESAKANANLGALLTRSIGEGQATKERLLEIETLVNEERELNEDLLDAADRQADTLGSLSLTNATLEVEIDALTASVAVTNQRVTDLDSQLGVANERIVSLTEAHDAAVANALEWKDAVAVSEGCIAAEKTWKWRFFWWAVGATVLIAGYVALRLHPVTRTLVP